jgi:hypothetical protein
MKIVSSKQCIVALCLLSGLLLSLLVWSQCQLMQIKSDIRFARDAAWGFRADRDLALKGDLSKAAFYLRRLETPVDAGDSFRNAVADFLERERKHAVKDIVVELRAKTGKDFGDSPEAWINALEAAEHAKPEK